MTNKLKYIVPVIALILFSGYYYNQEKILGEGTQTEEEFIVQLEKDLVAEQVEWKKTHDKYKTKLKEKKLPYNLDTWTDEYVTPDGSVGYQIYIEKADGSIKSFGEGNAKDFFSHDWTNTATSTK